MMHLRSLAIPAALLSLTLLSSAAIADNGNHYGQIKKGGATSVPELSIGAAGAALVIIVGGTLIARGRRRRADKK